MSNVYTNRYNFFTLVRLHLTTVSFGVCTRTRHVVCVLYSFLKSPLLSSYSTLLPHIAIDLWPGIRFSSLVCQTPSTTHGHSSLTMWHPDPLLSTNSHRHFRTVNGIKEIMNTLIHSIATDS